MGQTPQEKLTKAEIVDSIREHVPVSKKRIQRVVDRFILEIKEGLRQDKVLELRGLGTFEVKQRKGRKARNPKTGERVSVEAHGVVVFRPGKELKEMSWPMRT